MTLAPPAPDQRAWLDLLTAPEAGELLAVALGADGASLDTWRVHQVHARPGAEVTVGYDVVARRALAAGPGGGTAAADAAEYLLATTAPLSPDAVGAGVVRLADGPRVVHVWRHPADPLLPGLAAACDAGELARRLAAAGALAPGEAVESVTMVAYRPLRRAVLRARTSARTVYVKVVRPDRARSLVRRHDLFRSTTVNAPRCLAWDDDGVVVFEEARGPSLAQHLAALGPDGQPTAIDPRELLRALDALPARATTLRRRPAWSERVEHYAASALAVHALDPARVDRVARAVRTAVATRDPGPVVATHGDFYEANVLLDVPAAAGDPAAPGAGGARVGVLLDVDTLGPGHRVDDLACLVAHLAVLPSLAPAVYGGVRALVDRCLAVFDERVDPAALRARAAGVVLSLTAGAATRDLADAWLRVAEGLLDAAPGTVAAELAPVPESTLIGASSASHA
ncbi:aminoglycoside phosphotransferase family protein [Cellulosimicrobium cellulans]|uniref:aminoglycoside phosphotransferase family protein n=1 Tax=Cellulosimicrobium cellulans TaxID=1710 RepID=UPI0020972F5E|nr:aminoglycoside phosphotransferase family protein [Cellulosimicrobium cellulans]MCO7275272.1 aminoglycoside phosphotransferase family protein [Cellulosimicrobium cellulans]